jgi:hypothetical protein
MHGKPYYHSLIDFLRRRKGHSSPLRNCFPYTLCICFLYNCYRFCIYFYDYLRIPDISLTRLVDVDNVITMAVNFKLSIIHIATSTLASSHLLHHHCGHFIPKLLSLI